MQVSSKLLFTLGPLSIEDNGMIDLWEVRLQHGKETFWHTAANDHLRGAMPGCTAAQRRRQVISQDFIWGDVFFQVKCLYLENTLLAMGLRIQAAYQGALVKDG